MARSLRCLSARRAANQTRGALKETFKMIIRSLSQFSRRFLTTLALGAFTFPAVALACPTPEVAAAGAQLALAAAPSGLEASVIPSKSHMTLVGAAIATDVEGRTPIGEGDSFDSSVGSLYAWVRVRNLGEDSTITMVWKKDGKDRLSVLLPVGHSYGWKTWSQKRISARDAGVWTVEVYDAEGLLVGSTGFEVSTGGNSVGSL
jgi:hypothetical protein